ncbi:hypothetical protein Jab_1c14510 [Janthinobacterium sp. HH01]|uniref:heparin lyase I family protein n=1 Tax=Janthinobacterium sp. HH01 TaxID=1198452 RepID=UPI0002AE8E99|nr:heparin lyase I family protein [Janthinobacterium sp. HH01]ELX12836.1 hypothetical protein Jab_1c14510 [Janthinobacterium sp. HH01]
MRMLRHPLILGAFCAMSSAARAENLLQDFQGLTAATFPATYQLLSSSAGNMSFVSDPNGKSSKGYVQLTLTDNGLGKAQQTAIGPLVDGFPVDAPHWYGFSVYLPKNWDFNDATPVKIAEVASSDSALPSPLSLIVSGSDLQVVMSANHRDPASSDKPTATNSQSRIFTLMPAVGGQWHCVVVRASWSGKVRQGDMQIWTNNQVEPAYQALRTHNSYQGVTHLPRVGLSVPGALGPNQRKIVTDAVILGGNQVYLGLIQQYMPCNPNIK